MEGTGISAHTAIRRTPEAQDPRRRELIAHTLDDLNRLCDRAKELS